MPEIPLRDVIDNLRSRLQTDLEAELANLADSHDKAVDDARRTAEAAAEQRWAERLEAARADWNARLQAEVSSARDEAERRAVAESARARMDAEQAAAEAAAALRREMEQALAEERARAVEERDRVAADRDRAAADRDRVAEERDRATVERNHAAAEQERLDAERQRAERELAEARAALEAERERSGQAIEEARRTSPAFDAPRLLAALSAIDAATSLTEVIRATISTARAEAARAALFIVNGAQLDEWTVPGMPPLSPMSMRVDGREAGLIAESLRRGEPVVSGADGVPPAFAALPEGRRAVAVPFVFGGQPVAVLYADEAAEGQAQDGWPDAVQILGRHASATAACITARKAAEAMRILQGEPAHQAAAAAGASDDMEQGARRYARLLVSEIKLYNEAAVRAGRQKRDLLQRLKPEIDRARRLYEERVSKAVSARDAYFQQELVQTLADGDPSLIA